MSPKPERKHPIQNPITLARDFNPQVLPELTPTVADAQPWTWLAGSNMSAEERASYLSRFVRGTGTVDPTDPDLTLQPRPRDEVIAGHLSQHVLVDLPGAPTLRVRLSSPSGAAEGAAPDHSGRFPFDSPVAIVGTTAPVAAAAEVVGRRLGPEMADYLAGRGIESWEAVAADHGREWVDQVLIVDYTDSFMVRLTAQVYLQPFVTVWRPADEHPGDGVLEVIDVSDPGPGRVVASRAADLHQVGVRTCPLIPGSERGDLCRLHGGPWVSRSIRAASRWESRRARMIRALGCDTCGEGAFEVFGNRLIAGRGAISIRPDTSTPTRHDRLVVAQADGQEGASGA